MKIIIPLGGEDKEIKNEFFKIKPLVTLGKETMIETFIKKFQFKNEYIFLCRQHDLINTDLLSVLKKLKIKKKIVPIEIDTSNVISTIKYAEKYLKNNESLLICHPDSINYFESLTEVREKLFKSKLDGYVFSFDEESHTNTIESQTGRVIIKKNKILKINEKSIQTNDSQILTGMYFFKRWDEFKKYSKLTLQNQSPVQGRYFISQIYNEYLRNKKKLGIIKIKKHITFGLIPYIKEYNFWFDYFKFNIKKKLSIKNNFLNLVPSCGDGLRFKVNNRNNFKPLIKVNKEFMILKALRSLPKSNNNVVIMRSDHNKKFSFKKKIIKNFKKLDTLILKNKTDGMASTCYEYLKNHDVKTPIIISSCDYSVIYNEEKFLNLLKFFNPDVVVWTFKKYPDARIAPFAYAYCEIKNGKINRISEKTPISNTPHLDHIAQGIFYFKSKDIFLKAYKNMIEKKDKINNEYYVANSINELINQKYKVLPFEVDQYICLGTIQDLKVYNFWSEYFYDKI